MIIDNTGVDTHISSIDMSGQNYRSGKTEFLSHSQLELRENTGDFPPQLTPPVCVASALSALYSYSADRHFLFERHNPSSHKKYSVCLFPLYFPTGTFMKNHLFFECAFSICHKKKKKYKYRCQKFKRK